jgi:hypothetical protein
MVVMPNPEFARRVRALAEGEWREPVVVIYLSEVKPQFDVPGRRKDGTVQGRRLVRRFFWNILRGVFAGVANLVMVVWAGGMGNVLARDGRVTGPANAQALGLVDAARSARNPWLVHSPSHVAVVDTGALFQEPADMTPPVVLWHAAAPYAPQVSPHRRRLSWPDGSTYQYHTGVEESTILKQARRG